MTREERAMELWTAAYNRAQERGGGDKIAKTDADAALKAFDETFPESLRLTRNQFCDAVSVGAHCTPIRADEQVVDGMEYIRR